MITIINICLSILAIYTSVGFLFAVFFIFKGERIDPLLKDSKKKIRFLLFFGVMATWPFLIQRVFKIKKGEL